MIDSLVFFTQLVCRPAAVDDESLAVDKGSVITGEKESDRGDLRALSDTRVHCEAQSVAGGAFRVEVAGLLNSIGEERFFGTVEEAIAFAVAEHPQKG